MPEYELYSRVVSPDALTDAIIGLASSPQALSIDGICDIINKSGSYTRAVVLLGQQLKIIKEIEDGYVIDKDVREDARKMSPDQGSAILNKYVQRYDPFMTFTSFLDKGYNPEQSAQSIVTIFDMDAKPDITERQFLKIGHYTNLITDGKQPQPTIEVDTLPAEYIEDLEDASKSEAKARLFVHERLGEKVVSFADPESLEKVQEALLKYSTSPNNAIVDTVAGAENITRELAVEHGSSEVDYSNANGIGSLVKAMRRDDLVLKRHLHGANYLGGMRIPGAHGKEAETLESWEVDPEVALEVVLSSISYIRSIYWYVTENRQVL